MVWNLEEFCKRNNDIMSSERSFSAKCQIAHPNLYSVTVLRSKRNTVM